MIKLYGFIIFIPAVAIAISVAVTIAIALFLLIPQAVVVGEEIGAYSQRLVRRHFDGFEKEVAAGKLLRDSWVDYKNRK